MSMEDADTSGLLSEGYPPMYRGTYFDDDIVPEVRLENGLDMQALRSGEGAEFSIDGSEVPIECEELNDYDTKEAYKYFNPDMGENEDSDEEPDDDLSPFERRAKKMIDVTPNQDGGVLKKLQKEGSGNVIKPDAFVTVHYNMYLEHQDEPADSSFLRNKPLRFPVGRGVAVPGMDIAVQSMRVGETSCFLFKPTYFLGESGCPPRVPPNSTAMFHIELKAAEDSGGAEEYYSMTSHERREASFDLVKQVAMREKEEGNSHYKGERYGIALRCYNRAIRITDECRLQNDDDERKQQKFLFQLYKNAALSAMKLNKPKLALANINKGLHIDQTHAQPFYIKGKALGMVGDYEAARDALLKAKQLKPNDHDIANELKRLDKRERQYKEAQTTMYQKMIFGKQAGSASAKDRKPLVTDHTAPPKTDDSYVQIILDKLEAFKLNSDTDSLPLPRELSSTQLLSIQKVCDDLDLEIDSKSSDTNVHFMIKKRKNKEL